MKTKGIVTIAYGYRAKAEAMYCLSSISERSTLPRTILCQRCDDSTDAQKARADKTSLYSQSSYDQTLYLDADTRVRGNIAVGFDILDDGYDMVIVPGTRQEADQWWHIQDEERVATYIELEYIPISLQGGVFWFAKNQRTQAFFEAWDFEWRRFYDQDMAALVRALHHAPVKLWCLGHDFNGGAVIQHLYGRCRE